MIDIKQYLKETNSVLLTKQAYKYLTEKASAIEKLEEIKSEMDIIAELEKIKEEILNLGFTGWADKPKLDREEVLMILDKHISELSGENKQSRCNNCQNNADELSGECYECVKGIKDNHIAELKGENK